MSDDFSSIPGKLGADIGMVRSHEFVGGGSINETFKLLTSKGCYFLKRNVADRYPGMFLKEKQGLSLLRGSESFRIPDVIACGDQGRHSYLLLEWVERGATGDDFFYHFAQALSTLHSHSDSSFGLDADNYIGSLPQYNDRCLEWSTFFVEQRVAPQLKMAVDEGLLTASDQRDFDSLFTKLDGLFPSEPPSLLHGDLWSGNYTIDEHGKPVVFDPAVYYGHRYMDLGMMKLFGGFDQRIFDHYDKINQLDSSWVDGIEVANLYPLLVHVNLFGAGYVRQVKAILERYS